MKRPATDEEREALRRANAAIDTFRANLAELAHRMSVAADSIRDLFASEDSEPWEQDPDTWKGNTAAGEAEP